VSNPKTDITLFYQLLITYNFCNIFFFFLTEKKLGFLEIPKKSTWILPGSQDRYPDLKIRVPIFRIPPGEFGIRDPGMDLKDPGTDLGIRVLILNSGYIMLTGEMRTCTQIQIRGDPGTLSRFCQLSLQICNLRSCTTATKLFLRLKEKDPVYILIRFDEPLRT
jgi:hypothetical protein